MSPNNILLFLFDSLLFLHINVINVNIPKMLSVDVNLLPKMCCYMLTICQSSDYYLMRT